ncbi:MAG: hypothetical protein CO163_02465 [Rhodobacterales bacterium CG_4_9_14_3_um_filter_71_31]|nr:MAG: hypothetical protein CO163_02465 [Rhodobacterales bacterium CG_4_9_14_3_um_filter_71_31]
MKSGPMRIAALLAAAFALGAAAQPADQPPPVERVIAALDQNRIAITAGFDGTEIFVYGAIARDRLPGPQDADVGVVVLIAGPSAPVVVRRKQRTLGIWVNRDMEVIDAAPSYYAIATSAAFYDTISHTEDLRRRVSLEHALRFVGARSEGETRTAFLDAVVRLRRQSGLYVIAPQGVEVIEGTLFNARFVLPANIVEGLYSAQVLLTRQGAVVDAFEAQIDVAKAGVERWLFDLSRQRALLYGLMAITVALAAGLAASEAFRWLKR